jgi:hypothetical protein
MLGTSFLLTLAATGLAQAPGEGYRKVLITSNVNTKFVIVPKAATAGSTTVMYVMGFDKKRGKSKTADTAFLPPTARPATTSRSSSGG